MTDAAGHNGMDFIIVGDTKSPMDFALPSCRFLGIQDQLATNFRFASACPLRSYARCAPAARLARETERASRSPRRFFGPQNLMRDFADEIPGYLHNDRIRRALEDVSLAGGNRSLRW
jgi:hypothetical protein